MQQNPSDSNDEGYLETHFQVRIILEDSFGMSQEQAQEVIDKIREAGIEFQLSEVIE